MQDNIRGLGSVEGRISREQSSKRGNVIDSKDRIWDSQDEEDGESFRLLCYSEGNYK